MKLIVEQIATAIRCPVANVAANWPILKTCLEALAIYSDAVAIAMLATVAVETAHTFKPIHEYGSEDYLNNLYDTRTDLGNTPEKDGDGARYCGRGFIQITGKANHERYGQLLGVDLVNHPELALDPNVSASHAAAFFRDRHIASPAEAGNWRLVRKKVNGGFNGFADFLRCVNALKANA